MNGLMVLLGAVVVIACGSIYRLVGPDQWNVIGMIAGTVVLVLGMVLPDPDHWVEESS